MDEFSKDFYYIIKAKALFKIGSHNESIVSLNNIRESSTFFYQKTILLYEICLTDEDSDMCDSIKEILQNYKPNEFQ